MDMENVTNTQVTRDEILNALLAFINKRTGMEYANYGDRNSFMSEYRGILNDGKDARTLLRHIALQPYRFPVEALLSAMDRHGRLTFNTTTKTWAYIVGQYWCTEYRSAAIRYLLRVMRMATTDHAALVKEIKALEHGRRIVRDYL